MGDGTEGDLWGEGGVRRVRGREGGDKMREKDGGKSVKKPGGRGEAVAQPNGLVSPLALENSPRKGRETCIVQ